jgi:hypothetical protein
MRISRTMLLLALFLLGACGTSTPSPTLSPATTTAPPTPTEPPTEPVYTETRTPTSVPATLSVIDDFEASATTWLAGTADYFNDSSATNLALTSENVSQGKQALQLNFESNDLPKAIFFLDKPLDLSQGRYLKFDVYNPGSLGSLGIAMITGPDQVWVESDGVGVPSGKLTTLSFDLTASTYKTEATNWEFRAAIADLNEVSRLAIIVYPAKTGSIIMDSLRITETP